MLLDRPLRALLRPLVCRIPELPRVGKDKIRRNLLEPMGTEGSPWR